MKKITMMLMLMMVFAVQALSAKSAKDLINEYKDKDKADYDKCTMIQVEGHIGMDDIQNLVKSTKVLNGEK